MVVAGVSWSYAAYLLAFGLAAGGCALALARANGIEDDDTRRGLVGLLAASGGWALLELVFLLAATGPLAYGAYVASLVVGLTTVGGWLYFCSAYTGRSFHRSRTYRRAAVVVYLGIVAVKLTNPVHGLYFATEFTASPFPHLTIRHGIAHWVVSGLSYALAAVGFFMLYELFLEADFDTRPLGAAAAATALPVVLDVVGFARTPLIDINYEPIGVAVFAVSVLFVYQDRLLAVQFTGGTDDAVVYLDDDGRIREANRRAQGLFPSLSDATGEAFADALPAAADALDSRRPVVELTDDGEDRYYLVSDATFSLGATDVGRLVVFTDVTETERQRRELQRHDEQLEGFAAAIRHELLNTLQIVEGWIQQAGEAIDDGDAERARRAFETASGEAGRMSAIVDDLAKLARYGQTPERTSTLPFAETVESAFESVDANGLALSVDGDGEVEANHPRLVDLFENAFVFADHVGATSVEVSLNDDGFAIVEDEPVPVEGDGEAVFEYGRSAPDPEAGLTLPNLRMLARTHGWETSIEGDDDGGVRIDVSGVRVLARE